MFYKHKEVAKNSVGPARKTSELTQSQLADAIGVTRQTIIAIEKGNYTPSILLALKLAQTLNKSVEELFSL